MNLNDEQYERMARKLDGSQPPLTEQEQAAVDEIVRDESWLSGRLDVQVPQRAMSRARNRLAVAVAARPGRSAYIGYVAAVASAAALILLTFSFITMMQPHGDAKTPVAASPPDDLLFAPSQNNYDIAIVAAQADELAADMASSSLPSDFEMQIDELEKETEEFWLYDSLYEYDYSGENPA